MSLKPGTLAPQWIPDKKEWGKLLENLFWIGLVGSLIALIFALTQAKKVLKQKKNSLQN